MRLIYHLLLVTFGANGLNLDEFSLDKYHTHEEMTEFLKDLTSKNPELTRLYTVGQTYEGRDLWVVEISAGEEKRFRPNVKLVGNIHGNEAVGREILLQLTKYLVESYNEGDGKIRNLLDFARVHILPSLNPDGFKLALNLSTEDAYEECSSVKGRNNVRDLDLNRNFPEPHHVNRAPLQLETIAVMNWMDRVPFVLSAALHGGALVANYPFDSRKDDISDIQEPHLTPDDDVFRHLASLYSSKHPTMHKGEPCPGPYPDVFPGGITNGAAWYHLNGGMQDYNYIFHGCMELTLEISCCKFPNASELPRLWKENKEPLLSFLGEVRRGIRGVVVDATGEPIPNATLHVRGRGAPFFTSTSGEFWRILLPNAYFLEVNAEGYQNKTVSIQIREPDESNKWSQFMNITLRRFTSAENLNEKPTWSNASKSDDEDVVTNYTASVVAVVLGENTEASTNLPTEENNVLLTNNSSVLFAEESKSIAVSENSSHSLLLFYVSLWILIFFNKC